MQPTCGRTRGRRGRAVPGRPGPPGLEAPPDRGNVNDVSPALDLVDGIPPVAGRPGRPRRRPGTLLADKGYDSDRVRCELAQRRIVSIISYRGTTGVQRLGKLRYVVEQALALLHQFKRLAVRWERHLDLHEALVSLGCALICRRRLRSSPAAAASRSPRSSQPGPWAAGSRRCPS